MDTTRREFVERAGLAAAVGLLGGCGTHRPIPTLPVRQGCISGHTFENWSHTIRFQPRRFCSPRTEQEVIDLVKEAAAAGTHLRTQGAGHSFSQLLPTEDTLLSLDNLDLGRPISVDGNRATIPGGMRLKNAIPELRKRGLGFKNLGSITEQSIAGAFSTGTHGSGLGLGAISTQVVGLRMVTGNGDVHTITEADAQDLAAARINLGALGIITEVTLECVPDYQLEYTARLTTFDNVIGQIDSLIAENERVVLWWLVGTLLPRDTVVLITKNPVGAKAAVGAGSKVSRKRLSKRNTRDLARAIAGDHKTLRHRAGAAPGPADNVIRHVIEPYDQVLTIPLLPVFHRECEYAIPVDKAVEALKAMREIFEEGDMSLDLPVELRWVAQDDVLLSPCNGRAVCYIGASLLAGSTEVFERFEPLMKSLGGKPHWGKNFTVTQEEVAKMYPATYDTFRAARDRFDPKRVFANSMLTELFP